MLIYLYIFFLLFWFFDFEFIFLNEELLICVVMLLVFYFLMSSFRKLVNAFFFFRIEFIYFSFLYLLKLNIGLINKILDLLSLIDLRFDMSLLSNTNLVYRTFFEFFQRNVYSFALLSLKQFIFLFVFYLHAVRLILDFDKIYIGKYTEDNNSLSCDIFISGLSDLKLIDEVHVYPVWIDIINSDLIEFIDSDFFDLNVEDLSFFIELSSN